MRIAHILFVTLFLAWGSLAGDSIDSDFAEFEEFDGEDEPAVVFSPVETSEESPLSVEEVDVAVDEDEEEDDNEFNTSTTLRIPATEKPASEAKITIADVPIHFRANWDSYWLEGLMIAGLLVYFINFITGRSKNTRLANVWLQTHRQLLEENFSLVGDDGSQDINESALFVKESENVFTLWCSGRTCCEGMLVELKLIKRQDLVSILAGMMRPQLDQVSIKVTMNRDDMDSYVMCVGQKRSAQRLSRDMADLSVFCPERKAGERYNLPATFNVMSEIAEATSAMLDAKVVAVLNRYPQLVDYIHISDQYSGAKQQEDAGASGANLKLPDCQKVLIFGFNIPLKGMSLEDAMGQLKPLMVMVFYCIEKVKRYRLSKEGKNKADKNRARVEEAFLKSTHQARAEAAAARREERRRLEKEKVMADEDPDRQRRWEEREQKRQAKKRAPRMKQLKVKAL